LRRTQSTAVIVRRMRAVMRKSKALWPQPEALLPRAARRNALQFLVQPFVREIHRVGDADHGLECNETAVREVGIGPGQRYAGRGRRRRRWGCGGLSLAGTRAGAPVGRHDRRGHWPGWVNTRRPTDSSAREERRAAGLFPSRS